jgi:hypothetical protein
MTSILALLHQKFTGATGQKLVVCTISRSSTKVEYKALANATAEIMRVQKLIDE